jgi:hypothetical protein
VWAEQRVQRTIIRELSRAVVAYLPVGVAAAACEKLLLGSTGKCLSGDFSIENCRPRLLACLQREIFTSNQVGAAQMVRPAHISRNKPGAERWGSHLDRCSTLLETADDSPPGFIRQSPRQGSVNPNNLPNSPIEHCTIRYGTNSLGCCRYPQDAYLRLVLSVIYKAIL